MKAVPFVLCSSLLAACGPTVQAGSLLVTTVDLGAVEMDSIVAPGLEVEIHLYTQPTMGARRFLGCAGADTGLANVTTGNARFEVSAHFESPDGSRILGESDLGSDPFLLVVSEDDENPCPVEQDATRDNGNPLDDQDDLIGMSAATEVSTWKTGGTLVFGPVKELALRLATGADR